MCVCACVFANNSDIIITQIIFIKNEEAMTIGCSMHMHWLRTVFTHMALCLPNAIKLKQGTTRRGLLGRGGSIMV